MTDPNIQQITASYLALGSAIEKMLAFLVANHELSEDDAVWVLAGLIDSQPELMTTNPQINKQIKAIADGIKTLRAMEPTIS